MIDVLKCHILGEVEYAQHNFARLRPLLYSVDGRAWAGTADKAWFPNAGLVFSLSPDLRFAHAGSLWTFQVRPNERQSGADEGKDVYMTIQVKPAIRFLTELDPLPREELRKLATIDGLNPKSGTGGVVFPEEGDRWVLAPDLERGADERARVTNDRALGHMRVLEGTLEELAGCATADGRWALPIISSGHGSEVRNWRPPSALAEQIAGDLRRWLPHAPNKAKAAAAASALRELAPALDAVSAVRSAEVRAALDRVIALTENAESLTTSTEELVEALLASPAIASAVEAQKTAIREDLERRALESAERFEAEARERLATEQTELRAALVRDQASLAAVRAEIEAGETDIADIRRRQRTETAAFTRSLEALIARAKKEPAAYAAEWLAKLGLNEAGATAVPAAAGQASEEWLALETEIIGEADLGRALSQAAPIRNDGVPKFMLMDAALRARELVIGVGSHARDVVEAWLLNFVPLWTVASVADPSLLSFAELLPSGPRGAAAPLADAVTRANGAPGRPVVALLDDIDVAAGGFWLPQAARALRRPGAHGLPANLFLVGLVEGDPGSLGFSLMRAGELFPLDFDGVTPVDRGGQRATPRELALELFERPLAMNGVADRVAALGGSAARTFNPDDVALISGEFRAFLAWAKSGGERPGSAAMVASALASATSKMLKGGD